MPRNAAGSRGSGNDCRGWNEPRGFAGSASSASSPSAPLRCTTASRDDRVDTLAVDRLHDLQTLHHGVHLPALPGEDRLRGLVAVVDDAANLLVDEGGHLFRIVALLAEVAAEEDKLLLVAHRHG